jgi:hypothetical protein
VAALPSVMIPLWTGDGQGRLIVSLSKAHGREGFRKQHLTLPCGNAKTGVAE